MGGNQAMKGFTSESGNPKPAAPIAVADDLMTF
jgi:hypothetical protein